MKKIILTVGILFLIWGIASSQNYVDSFMYHAMKADSLKVELFADSIYQNRLITRYKLETDGKTLVDIAEDLRDLEEKRQEDERLHEFEKSEVLRIRIRLNSKIQ